MGPIRLVALGVAGIAAAGVYASDPIATITAASAAVSQTTMTQWLQRETVSGTFYYAVSAFDLDGNESAVGNEISAVRTGMSAR